MRITGSRFLFLPREWDRQRRGRKKNWHHLITVEVQSLEDPTAENERIRFMRIEGICRLGLWYLLLYCRFMQHRRQATHPWAQSRSL